MVSLEFGAKRYNIAVKLVQKETASLLKRDCRARATHPGAVDYMCETAKKAARARWVISQSG
jgi:hypothetical protein